MIIDKAGKVTENFYVIGHSNIPVFLLDGPRPVLFDAGFASLGSIYVKEIRKILGNRSPAYLFLTHSHFDHIGAAAYFKKVWPEIRIGGSARAREILSRPNAIRLIRELNQEGGLALRAWGDLSPEERPFEPFDLDFILTPGDMIELGPLSRIQVIHAPGHTWDFLSFWALDQKILVASEAVGSANAAGQVFNEFIVDYDAYLHSQEALSRLDADVLCPGHSVVFTGADVKAHIKRSLKQTVDYLVEVEEILREEKGDIDRAAARIKASEWVPKPEPKLPEKPYMINTMARVKHIWERMQKNLK